MPQDETQPFGPVLGCLEFLPWSSLFQGDGTSGDYLSAEKLELQCYKMLQAERAQKWGSIARDH